MLTEPVTFCSSARRVIGTRKTFPLLTTSSAVSSIESESIYEMVESLIHSAALSNPF